MTKKQFDIMNPKYLKASNYWYGLKPLERFSLMKVVNSKKRTQSGQFRDIIRYIEKNK
jgi:hypothetical protein